MQFQKGQSGNPGGRPKGKDEVRDLARDLAPEAITTLAAWMRSDNAKASVSACQVLLDRGFGKPTQIIGGDVHNPVVHRVMREVFDPKNIADTDAESLPTTH